MTQIPVEIADNAQFHIQIRQAILAAQHSSRQVGLLMIDIDAGEPCFRGGDGPSNGLSEKAFELVTGTFANPMFCAEFRGPESAVLLSSLRDTEDALLVAEKILRELDQLVQRENRTVKVRPQIGVALFPNHGSSRLYSAGLRRCRA